MRMMASTLKDTVVIISPASEAESDVETHEALLSPSYTDKEGVYSNSQPVDLDTVSTSSYMYVASEHAQSVCFTYRQRTIKA